MKSVHCRVVLFVLLVGFSKTSNHPHSPRADSKLDNLLIKYDSEVSRFFAESNLPGAAIAIVAEDSILYMKGFGSRKVGEAEAIDANTVFRIASVSKGFASVLTGLLVKDRILNWDDRVTAYLPNFSLKDSTNTRELTIRHILSHTSGLIPHAYDNLLEARIRFEDVARKLKEVNIVSPVGKFYAYQNVVYSLIGPIIRTATGREYQDVLMQRLLKPLGMKNTSLSRAGLTASGNFATPHIKKYGKWLPTNIKDTYYSAPPAAGINASIHDMAQWLRALVGGMPDVVPPDVVQEVSEPLIETPYEMYRFNWNRRIGSSYYGMGWRVFDYAGRKLIFHSGGIRGYISQIAFLPKEKIGIVVLQNSWGGFEFAYKFLDMYLNLDKPEPNRQNNFYAE
jgi:beta-lactamase class C